MDLAARTNLKTEQKLVVSQRLHQQLSILYMTIQEMTELVCEQIQSNPMLDVEEIYTPDNMFTDVPLETIYTQQSEKQAWEDDTEYLANCCGELDYRASKNYDRENVGDFLDYSSRPDSLSEYQIGRAHV